MLRSFEVEPGAIEKVEVSAWPIPAGSPFPGYLSQYAEQYVEALRDPHFPRCDISTRPTSQLKQFWFLSRSLAGHFSGSRHAQPSTLWVHGDRNRLSKNRAALNLRASRED